MSVDAMLNNTIKNISSNLTNEFAIQNVISELVTKFNQSPIITDQNKMLMNQYYRKISGGQAPKLKISNMTGGAENVLQQALAYYLSNINKYDGVLVNRVATYGLGMDNIIVLILINNIYDIKLFCKSNHLNQQQTTTIITLKRLSALHNLETNF